MDELAARGIRFVRYEGFAQDEQWVSRDEAGPRIASSTDPAGNILSVVQT